jgi:hypothetical protein
VEVIIQIIKQLPPIWPRLALLIGLIVLVALPQTRRILTRRGPGNQRLQRAKDLLAVRKLQIEVEALRAANPEVGDSILDEQIEGILAAPVEEDEEASPPPRWAERLKLAGAGGLGFMLFGILAAGLSGRREGIELFTVALKELLVIIPCALIASAIPARNRWGPVFYGFLMPILVAALAVTARMQD